MTKVGTDLQESESKLREIVAVIYGLAAQVAENLVKILDMNCQKYEQKELVICTEEELAKSVREIESGQCYDVAAPRLQSASQVAISPLTSMHNHSNSITSNYYRNTYCNRTSGM